MPYWGTNLYLYLLIFIIDLHKNMSNNEFELFIIAEEILRYMLIRQVQNQAIFSLLCLQSKNKTKIYGFL